MKSRGVKRTIGLAAFLIAKLGGVYPQIIPFVPILEALGIAFGVGGLVHAAASGTLPGVPEKSV